MSIVSIIVPVYNVEQYVEKCLSSLINQTLHDIEIVIVNDGSTDGSLSICKRFADADNRICIINKKNAGLMAAWIDGVRASKSKYIGFVDSDDWVDYDFFENLYRKAIEKDYDLVVGMYTQEIANESKMYKRTKCNDYYGKDEISSFLHLYLLNFSYIDHPCSYCRWDKLYKRELLINNIGYFNTNISLGEDVNTNFSIIPDCKSIHVSCSGPLYHYRLNGKSIFNTFKTDQIKNIEELFKTLILIAQDKNLDTRDIKIFIGNMIFEEIKKIILCKDYHLTRSILGCILLSEATKATLRFYCCFRGFKHIVFYILLRMRLYKLLNKILRGMTVNC